MKKQLFIILIISLLTVSFFLLFRIEKKNQKNIIVQEEGGSELKEIQELPIRIPQEPLPELQEKAAIAILFEKGDKEKILYQKNIEENLSPASLAKLMSAMIVLDHYPLEKEVIVSQRAVWTEGESGRLSPGEKIKVKGLLELLLLVSSNDAATALAEEIGENKFLDLMNEKAKKIGLKNTHFLNPHGLDEKGQYSTAYDLAKLTKYSIKNYPLIWETLREREKDVIGKDNLGREILHHLRNTILMHSAGEALLNDSNFLGGKTGYTQDVNESMILAAKTSGKVKGEIVIVILGVGIGERVPKAKQLYDWGLKAFKWE